MRLSTWLDDEDISDSAFARLIESGRVAVGRYRRGERMPETAIMEKIIQATGGAVTAQDMHETRLEWLAQQSRSYSVDGKTTIASTKLPVTETRAQNLAMEGDHE